jgi:hypothetical protein
LSWACPASLSERFFMYVNVQHNLRLSTCSTRHRRYMILQHCMDIYVCSCRVEDVRHLSSLTSHAICGHIRRAFLLRGDTGETGGILYWAVTHSTSTHTVLPLLSAPSLIRAPPSKRKKNKFGVCKKSRSKRLNHKICFKI